jgi:hypothetical protein
VLPKKTRELSREENTYILGWKLHAEIYHIRS